MVNGLIGLAQRAAVLFFFVFFLSCTKKQEGAFRVAYYDDFSSLDPHKVESKAQLQTLSLVYETLLTYAYGAQTFELRPRIAEALPDFSPDGSQLEIKIKEGVHFAKHPSFAEGGTRELVAQDFVYSLLRVADPNIASPHSWLLDGKIEGLDEWIQRQKEAGSTNYDDIPTGISIKDSYRVEISLRVRDRQFLHVLAHPALSIVPRESIEKMKEDFSKNPVGTGPYRFLRLKKGSELVFERNPDYWGERNAESPAQVAFLSHSSSEAALRAFKEGNLELLELRDGAFLSVVDPESSSLKEEFQTQSWHLESIPTLDVFYLLFNLDDPVIRASGASLRKAISLSLDRRKIAEVLDSMKSKPALGVLPQGIFGHKATQLDLGEKRRLEEAKAELARLAKKTPLKLLFADALRNVASVIVANLTEIGLQVEAEYVSSGDLVRRLQKKDFQISYISWEADYPDPENFLQLLYGPNRAPLPNFSNYSNKAYDREFEKMRALADGPERLESISRLQDFFSKDQPWAPLVFRQRHYLAAKGVENFSPSVFGESPFRHVSSKR